LTAVARERRRLKRAGYTALAKYLLNNSSALRAPSSLKTTDLAFDLGSEMKPWALPAHAPAPNLGPLERSRRRHRRWGRPPPAAVL